MLRQQTKPAGIGKASGMIITQQQARLRTRATDGRSKDGSKRKGPAATTQRKAGDRRRDGPISGAGTAGASTTIEEKRRTGHGTQGGKWAVGKQHNDTGIDKTVAPTPDGITGKKTIRKTNLPLGGSAEI